MQYKTKYSHSLQKQNHCAKRKKRTNDLHELWYGQEAAIWQHRDDNYTEIRTAETAKPQKVEMSFIGGRTGTSAARLNAFPTSVFPQTLSLRQ